MIIGVPKEIKEKESRVALIPAGVKAFIEHSHKVLIQKGAGSESGFLDEAYTVEGAKILETSKEVFEKAELLLKVKEPLPSEFEFLRPGQIIFTYLHLAAAPPVAQALIEKKVTGIAYETVQTRDGRLPLLQPMSEVAGRMAIQVGAHYLEKTWGGRGILLSGVPGVPPGSVTILGSGTVGTNAARIAIGMGAEVRIISRNKRRMVYLDEIFSGRIKCLPSNSHEIERSLTDSDLVIGAVLVPGAITPKLITEKMIRKMKPHSVFVDVSIDQGGCSETSRPTTHSSPVYEVHNVIHYAVTNMPGAVPHTSTHALTNETLPYALKLADLGLERAVQEDEALAKGVNTFSGHCVSKQVAEALGFEYKPLNEIIKIEEVFYENKK